MDRSRASGEEGSQGHIILAPCIKLKKDEDTDEEKLVPTSFKAVPVFRVEDTQGEPLDYQNIELPNLPFWIEPLTGVLM